MGLYRAFVFGALSLILLDLEIIDFEGINPTSLGVLFGIWILAFLILLFSDGVDYKKIRRIIKEELKKEQK